VKIAEARRRIADLEAEVARLSKALRDLANDCDLPDSCMNGDEVEFEFVVDHVSTAMIDCKIVGEFLDLLGAHGKPRHRDDVLEAIEELTWCGVPQHWRGGRG
jgi:hypothetical protein